MLFVIFHFRNYKRGVSILGAKVILTLISPRYETWGACRLRAWLLRGDGLSMPNILQHPTISYWSRDLNCESKDKRGRELTWQKVETSQ